MKIVKWDKYNPEKYPEFTGNKELCKAEEIIISELKKHGYHFDGTYHQNGEYGAPVFDNGKQYRTTLRAWGAIMASAYPDEIENSNGMGYVWWAFLMYSKNLDDKMKFPSK